MASWSALATYIRNTYKIADDQGQFMQLVFEVGGGRSQVVFIGGVKSEDGEFAVLSSPFARHAQLDLVAALERIGDFPIGGAVVIGDRVFLRHAVPLSDLDIEEFTGPLTAILRISDELERTFVGGDEF